MNLILKLFDPTGFPARWSYGKDILKIIKSNDTFSLIPTAVLSSSSFESEIKVCNELGAKFFKKCGDLNDLNKTII